MVYNTKNLHIHPGAYTYMCMHTGVKGSKQFSKSSASFLIMMWSSWIQMQCKQDLMGSSF